MEDLENAKWRFPVEPKDYFESQDGNAFTERITLKEAIDKYSNRISKEQLSKLKKLLAEKEKEPTIQTLDLEVPKHIKNHLEQIALVNTKHLTKEEWKESRSNAYKPKYN